MQNGPKHSAKGVLKQLQDNKGNSLIWQSQNPDFNFYREFGGRYKKACERGDLKT